MSEKLIDIGTQSSVNTILEKVGSNFDSNPFNAMSNDTHTDGIFDVGAVPGNPESCALFSHNNELYVIPHNTNIVYRLTNDKNCWEESFRLPFSIDVYNSRVLVYSNPSSKTTELHILGGYGKLARTHFRYDLDGDNGISIASEMPYDFCAGKAVVFNNEIHIFGGGTSNFSTEESVPDGFVNKHYRWNGYNWREVSTLPRSCYGATPFVCNKMLHLIGAYDFNSDKKLYTLNTSTNKWKANTINGVINNLFHPVVIPYNEFIYVFGGVKKAGVNIISITGTPESVEAVVSTTLVNTPKGSSINCQCALRLNNNLYVNAGDIIYIRTGNSYYWYPYKSTSNSIKESILLLKNNPYGEIRLTIGLLGQKGRRFINLDDNLSENLNFNLTNSVATNDNGDIYMFCDAVNPLNCMAYTKHVLPNGVASYVVNSFKIDDGLTNPLVIWYKDKFHLISNDGPYNHKTIDDCRSKLQNRCSFPGVLADDPDLNSIAIYKDNMYVTVTNDTNISLYRYNNIGWSRVSILDTSDIGNEVRSISLVVFQNRLMLFALIDNKLSIYIYDNSNSIIKVNTITTDWLAMKAIPYDGYVHIVGSDEMNNTSRLAYLYGTLSTESYSLFTINMNKGKTLLCDKQHVIPLYGYVEDVNCGYEAIDSGKYIFLLLPDSNGNINTPFTLT